MTLPPDDFGGFWEAGIEFEGQEGYDPYAYRDTDNIAIQARDGEVYELDWNDWRDIVYYDYDDVYEFFQYGMDPIDIMKALEAEGLWTEEDWEEWREWYDEQ